MKGKKIKIFTLGYYDNTSTSYLLDYFIRQGVVVDGVIFPKNKVKLNWKRFKRKIQSRGVVPTIKRIQENLLVRKRHIGQICQHHIGQVFFVDEVNSEKTRDILVSNEVELLLLTSTPIIKPILINIDGLTILNAHTGWLPTFRGLDANLKAMRDGQKPGVSIHRVTEKIDAGEIYLREHFHMTANGDILNQMDEKELHLAGKLLVEATKLKSRNMLKPIAVNEPLGKYEPPLTTNETKKIIQNIERTLRN